MAFFTTRVRYTAALAILAVLSVAQFAVLTRQMHDEAKQSKVLDLAARQAVLIERIAGRAAEDVAPASATPRDEILLDLRTDADALERNERILATGDPSINPAGWPPPSVRALELNRPYAAAAQIAAYVAHTRALIAHPRPQLFEPDYLYLVDMHDGLVALERRIVTGYVNDARLRHESLARQAAIALAIVLLTLVGEGLLIFAPMERAIAQQRDALLRRLTELRRSEERLAYRATHDALTGMLNRSALYDQLGETLHAADAAGTSAAVLFIDLNDVKSINDGLGHHAGDELIIAAADRLRTALPGEVIVRSGGDEFVAILSRVSALDDVDARVARVREGLRAPLVLGASTVLPTASIGVAIYPQDGDDAETLVRNADTAMYEAKRARRDETSFYRPEMQDKLVGRMHRAAELSDAIVRGELALVFQPIVDRDRQIVSAEALVRWEHPRLGRLSPDEFIPIAEETGAIRELDAWVLRNVCEVLRTWRDRGLRPIRATINLSARTLGDASFVQVFRDAVARVALPPDAIALEITEMALLRDLESAAATIAELRALGVLVAIDDFGTGYNSLAYLKRLRVDCLKIDRSFISEVVRDPNDAAIVASVLTLAKNLDLITVAEGVETEETAAYLTELGCDRLQGYLFARPVDEATIGAMLATTPAVALPA